MRNDLLPRRAENAHDIPKTVVVVFIVVTITTVARRLLHLFLRDGGANTIATIITFGGSPDPDAVIYNIFALWGLGQPAMGVMYVIVLVRYRNLIPLMWLFVLAEYVMRILIGKVLKPMGADYFAGTAPGAVGNLILVPLAALMLLLCLVGPKPKSSRGQEMHPDDVHCQELPCSTI